MNTLKVNILTELDLIHDQVTVGECSEDHLIRMLKELVVKLEAEIEGYVAFERQFI